MTIKEMRDRLGMTQEQFSKTYNIPKRTIQNWESGKRNPPEYVIEILEHNISLIEKGIPDPCLRYHISADIYLSPSMMDVLYERSIIIKERDVTDEVVKNELIKYIGAFAEVEAIDVHGVRNLKHKTSKG